ncbi:MAG TPA: acetamidase/formamidase family protein [Chthoniobacterales bacterium]
MANHTLSAERFHSRWNRDLPPVLAIQSGDTVEFECLDSSGGQVQPGYSLDDFSLMDRDRIHALTGPVYVEGAGPGDVLEVEVREIGTVGWGWTGIVPGLGFLPHRFAEKFLFIWEFPDGISTRSLHPAVVPVQPFCGVMGVAPGMEGEFRTRPPGEFGGNIDVRQLTGGARLFLPVLNPGALFSTGDMHAAQGDGEVCINAIECAGRVVLRFHVHRHQRLDAPFLRSPRLRAEAGPDWIFVESSEGALLAARRATERMVEFVAHAWRLPLEKAYVLCSVAMHLRLSQVVNVPLVTVTAALPCGILPEVESAVEILEAIGPLARNAE